MKSCASALLNALAVSFLSVFLFLDAHSLTVAAPYFLFQTSMCFLLYSHVFLPPEITGLGNCGSFDIAVFSWPKLQPIRSAICF